MSPQDRPGEVIALDPVASIDRVLDRVIEAGAALRSAPDDRVIAAIAAAAAALADPGSRLGAEARATIPARSGLHPANVERALATSLAALRAHALADALAAFGRAHAGVRTTPVRLAGLVLAGNVFTAVLRPLAWALLLRVPVALKPSSEDDGLAELFAVALAEADPEIGNAVALLRFARTEARMLDAMASRCDVLHAWGSDRSIAAIRAALPATTSFVGHGHGLGAVYVPADAKDLEPILDGIALDVALYDQRGCLSPHFVLVERGGAVEALELARALSGRSLAVLARTMPRGPLPLAVGASQVQWRGLGAVRGELFEGEGWAVTFEGGHPPRPSPGWRNVSVHEVADEHELVARLAPFGVHLKALGIAAPRARRRAIAARLGPTLAPRLSEPGAMQTPPLCASADGEPPWSGFVRRIDED